MPRFLFNIISSCCRQPALALCLCLLPSAALAFNFDDVAAKAKQLAESPYKKPAKNIPKALENITYDQYRDIRMRTDKTHWRNAKLPFELAFFHQGLFFESPVKINEVSDKSVQEIRFDPKSYNYGANEINTKDLTGLGFAGFRVHYNINTPQYKDEVIAFLGASYFRAVGKRQLYGLSARGLTIDTALNSGEEFPHFTEFWIVRPDAAAKELTIYALLDSRRLAGAYRFIVKPGVDTVVDVKTQLYLRENVSKLGIAPLTTMFFFGENQRASIEDYRPEVHDSDGLSVQSGTGEWLWRPLVNPKRLLVTSFATINPSGFGLMQRDRHFNSFEDLEAHYEARPSAWIEPLGAWGAGRVELVQIPTPDETNDNIVAFWIPDAAPRPGTPLAFEYRVLWQKDVEKRPPLSWVTQTRRGHGYRRKPDDSIAFLVDFEGPALKKLQNETSGTNGTNGMNGAKVEAIVTIDSNGKLLETNAYPNETTGGWRMTIRMRRIDDKKPVEMRGYLHSNNETLSETWSYILPPD
ncbi:glucan biosynthesis protein G [Noviherbaspirillum cavernae]|uniref:glucan biosynthesis protein G n=1 Tax=Noviherbaspirillum cavernae TaxID=2320862 RepID=UPI0011C3A7D2|nr:glucan biosynthesis protein G [Noviherbaspirillum cavernae]